jgi:hypothetical protein
LKFKSKTFSKILPAIMTVAFCICIITFAEIIQNKPGQKQERQSLRVSQYSDMHITENAKHKDERFAKVAFAPAPEKAEVYPDQFATILRAFRMLFGGEKFEPEEEHGTWLWTPIMQMTPEYMSSIVAGAKAEGVNVIYLSLDSYLDIVAERSEEAKEALEAVFRDKLKTFIWLANQEGIEVDAEAGWRNWAEEGHVYKPFLIVSFVKEFNELSEQKFRGFQYDVEPYLLDEYGASEEGKAAVLKNFLKLVDETAAFLKDSDLELSVVVPEFYDKRDEMTPKFEYKGKRDFAFKHLLGVLEEKPGSSVIIMSYRNFAEGEDGSIEVSKNEMNTAKRGRFGTNIIIAQETGNVLPDYITFHNTSKSYMQEQTEKLRSAFASDRNFQGLSFHYANAYLELE